MYKLQLKLSRYAYAFKKDDNIHKLNLNISDRQTNDHEHVWGILAFSFHHYLEVYTKILFKKYLIYGLDFRDMALITLSLMDLGSNIVSCVRTDRPNV